MALSFTADLETLRAASWQDLTHHVSVLTKEMDPRNRANKIHAKDLAEAIRSKMNPRPARDEAVDESETRNYLCAFALSDIIAWLCE